MKASLLAVPLLLLLAPGGPVFAQTLLPPLPHALPQEEAAPTLFSAQIGDAEVDFLLEGSWRTELSAALGLVITPEGLVYSEEFPGFGALWPPVFRNYPRLTFSIWLQQRYFLESSVIWDFVENPGYDYTWWDKNYWLAGYRGGEGEFLRSVVLGNREVAVDAYPFLEVPETGSSSLGASALMGAGRSTHQLMLRYDNNQPDEAVFRGKNRVEESLLGLERYLRGRFFRLPDAGVRDLEVYLEDKDGAFTGTDLPTGSSRRYRRATVDDAFLDAAGGFVLLKKASAGAVLVYYNDGSGRDVGNAALGGGALPGEAGGKIIIGPTQPFNYGVTFLGQAMADRRVSVGVRTALRLYKPGEFSPFESLASYATPAVVPAESTRMRVEIVAKGNADRRLSGTGVLFRLTPENDYLSAYRTDNARDLENLYPFLDPQFDPDNLLYGPNADASEGYLEQELLASQLTPVSAFGLGADVVPGSVQVLRNGVTETRFSFEASSGIVTFMTEIAPDDRLEVSFRRKQSLAGNGDLLFLWGNTVPLGGKHVLQAAAGLRWNAVPGTFAEEAYERTGSALVSAGLQGEAGPARYEVSAAVGFTNPDTTGRLRLLGMEGQGREIPLSESTAWPAAPPEDSVPSYTLAAANRGRLLYRDLPYESGSKPGPYVVSERLLLDFDLDGGEWAGTQIPLAPGQGLADLSGLESVSLRYRSSGVSGSVEAYLQLGDIAEDLDGDGTLDEEPSASSPGFVFNDQGVALRVGSSTDNLGNGRRDSEDVDGNGTLDPEDPDYLVTIPLGSVSSSGAISYSFGAADKPRLRRARSLRLVLVETAAAPASGLFEVEALHLEGSLFHGQNATAREIQEWAAAAPPPEELVKAHPEVSEIFHPSAETQKVLEVDFAGAGSVQGYAFSPTEGIDYRRIVYYYRLPAAPSGDLVFELLDDQDKGVTWTVPATVHDAWAKVEVDLDDRVVYQDGTAVSGATVDGDAGGRSLFLLRISSAGAGLLYIDELHLTDPKSAVGAAAKGRLDLKLPGTLWAVGGRPVLRDLSLRQEAAVASRGFSPLYGRPQSEGSFSSRTELSVGIGRLDLDADLQAAGVGAEVSVGGGHRLSLPGGRIPVSLTDSFRLSESASGLDLARGNSLRITAGRLASLGLEAEASSLEGLLTQTWGAELGLTPPALDLRHRLELTETRSGYQVPRADYFSNWASAYTLLAPWRGGEEEERLGAVDLAWSLATRPVGARLAAHYDTHSADILPAGRTQTSTLRLEASLPVTVRRREAVLFSLTPGYRREVQLVERLAAPGDLGVDLGEGLEDLAAQAYWFQAAPLDELFSSATAGQFADLSGTAATAVYTPEVYLTLSRFSSSRLYDLVLPSALELSMNRELRREGVLVGSRNNYRLGLQTRALNLFGELGAYPLFRFYRTDEASGSLQLTATQAEGVTEKLSLLAGQFLACDGERSRLTLENRFAYTYQETGLWSDTLGALYTWERRPPGGVKVPLLPAGTEAGAYWAHEESLSTTLSGGQPAEGAALHPLNLVLAHTTTLMLPEFGFLKGGISLGLDAEDVEGEGVYWRIGLKASLEAQIQF